MRSSQKSGRSRGKGNRGKQQGHSPNRVYESAGPEGKVRGTPQQIIDKYMALARDAQLSGDRVGSENFLQHAEHYARILIAVQEAQAERREQNQQNQQPQGGGQDAGDQNGGQRGERQDNRRAESGGDDQPSSDGLGAIEAAQEQPNIVDTPESKSDAPKPRARRPRPKPPAETADAGEGAEAAPTETAAE